MGKTQHEKEKIEIMSFSPEGTSPLAIRLFGSFDVQVNGCALPRLRSQKGQWLLSLLVLRHGQSLERAWLAGVLWPDSRESQALANLRLSLTDLRRALGAQATHLQAPTPRTLRFVPTGVWSDVAVFDAAVLKGADNAALETAVAVYRGALLEGCEEEWLTPERQVRAEAYLTTLETLASRALADGPAGKAVVYLRRLVAADPSRESAYRLLMQALTEAGDHAAVIQVYRDFRLYLHADLNTQPDEETVALYDRLLRERRSQASSPVAERNAPAGCLPHPLTYLIGREQEIEEVCVHLDTARLLTLSGSGGSGKTRLAIAVGERRQACFGQPVWFVPLVDVIEPHRLAATVRDTLGLPRSSSPDPLTQIIDKFAACPSLLILDNLEHLLPEGAAWVRDLLAHVPSLRCLVTSRQTLNIPGEQEFVVAPLPVPGLTDPFEHLLQCASVRLFLERAASRQGAFALTRQNAPTIAAVCRRVEGIPLALELTAAWAGVLTPAQMLKRLSERFELLTDRHSDLPLRHQTMREAIAGSLRLLPEPVQRFAAQLTIFRGGWTAEAAQKICDGEPKTLEYLRQLRQASLVVTEEAGEEIRFRFLETIREFVEEQLQTQEYVRLRRSHGAYYLQMAQAAALEMTGPKQSEWLDRLEAEHDNLRGAFDRCLDTEDADTGLVFAGLLLPFWDIRGYYEEGRERLEKALKRAEHSTDKFFKAEALSAVAQLASRQGDYRAAQRSYQQACPLQRSKEDVGGLAKTLFGLGTAALFLSDYTEAESFYGEALSLERARGNVGGEAENLSYLGIVAACQGRYAEAQARLEKAMEIVQEGDDDARKARALHHLGNVSLEQGNWESAQTLYEESHRIHLQLESRGWVGANLYKRGSVALVRGDRVVARSLLEQALAISREVGDQPIEAGCLSWLGMLTRQEGNTAAARSLLTHSLRIRTRIGVKREIVASVEWLAMVDLAEGYFTHAARLLGATAALRQEISAPLAPVHKPDYEEALTALHRELGEETLLSAWREGQALTLEKMLDQDQAVTEKVPSKSRSAGEETPIEVQLF